MGNLCQTKPDDDRTYSTQTVESMKVEGTEAFKITTKPITKCKAECLVLFADQHMKVENNEFLTEINDKIGSKVQEYLDAALENKNEEINIGDCIILDVEIKELPFKKIAVICIKIWEAESKGLNEPLQDDIESCLETLKSKEIKSICLTNFNTEFGIPSSIGNKTISRVILNKETDFEGITLALLQENHQKSIIEVVKKEQLKQAKRAAPENENSSSYNKKMSTPSIKSEYF